MDLTKKRMPPLWDGIRRIYLPRKVATTYSRKESTVFVNAISDIRAFVIRDTIQKVDAKVDAKNKVFYQKINFWPHKHVKYTKKIGHLCTHFA